MKKLLLIGPNTNKKDSTLTGGAVILFEHLLSELNKNNIEYILIDTNKKNYINTFIAYISIYVQILFKQYQVNHISLHSSRDYLYLAPLILIVCKLTRKKMTLRKFGGEAWKNFSEARGLKRWILEYIFKNLDGLFLEMKYLVKNFKKINSNTYWFPNVRNRPNIQFKEKKFSKRFVFMSHVKEDKGVNEVVEVSKLLDDDYTIDIYGKIDDEKYSKEYFLNQGVNYKGALSADEVLKTLATYDVLLLPTYYKGEGYPGIIIEGYSIGVPIIASSLEGIKEITDDYKTGVLIEPKNVDRLKVAIEYFNEENFEFFSKNAKKKFNLFDGKEQTQKFLEIIKSINNIRC